MPAVSDRLVLREILRLVDLANVVVIRADAGQQTLRPDRFGRVLRQRANQQTVVVRAGRFGRQQAQQRLAGIAPLQQRHVRADLEDPLDTRQDAFNDEGRRHCRAGRRQSLRHKREPERLTVDEPGGQGREQCEQGRGGADRHDPAAVADIVQPDEKRGGNDHQDEEEAHVLPRGQRNQHRQTCRHRRSAVAGVDDAQNAGGEGLHTNRVIRVAGSHEDSPRNG